MAASSAFFWLDLVSNCLQAQTSSNTMRQILFIVKGFQKTKIIIFAILLIGEAVYYFKIDL
jgi:hypothetical protein